MEKTQSGSTFYGRKLRCLVCMEVKSLLPVNLGQGILLMKEWINGDVCSPARRAEKSIYIYSNLNTEPVCMC